jgi:hypothetical protein
MLYPILDLLLQYFYELLSEIRGLLEALDHPPTPVATDAPLEAQ